MQPYLGVRYQVRYHRCNLRCPYCVASWDRQESLFDAQRFTAIVGAIQALPYRVSLRIGVGGEIFTSRELQDGVRAICNTPSSIRNVSFSTNLVASWSGVIAPFLASVDASRLGIGCTLHDTVIRDVDGFFAKVARIKRMGIALYVGLVAVPGRMAQIAEHRRRCEDLGVPLLLNGLLGKPVGVEGVDPSAEYPRDYTAEERRALRELWDTPHSYKLLVEGCRTQGMACSAGNSYVYLDHEGNVFPCQHIPRPLGNIREGPLVLQPEDTVCPSPTCWCGNENQALRIVDRNYQRSPTLRLFRPRPELPRERLYEGYNPSVFAGEAAPDPARRGGRGAA